MKRGVLRFMVEVVSELWQMNNTSPLILPCSINIASQGIHTDMMRVLPDEWNAILDKEIDGPESRTRKKDSKFDRYKNYGACKRVARTIMLGSAPSAGTPETRVLEKTRILLGVLKPEENISVFTEALGTLRDELSYLYTGETGNSFWFDTRPTLRKTVENRAAQLTSYEVDAEIKRRLPSKSQEYPFSGVSLWTKSVDVLDVPELQLVILSPDLGEAEAEEILLHKQSGDRLNRNTLVFLCTDRVKLDELRVKTRLYLAWKSVHADRESKKLTSAQVRETLSGMQKTSDIVDGLIYEA